MEFAGIRIDLDRNRSAAGDAESRIEAPDSTTQIWVVPTDEELIVGMQTVEVLSTQKV